MTKTAKPQGDYEPRLLTPYEALKHARHRIDERRLADHPQCALLRSPDVDILPPVLVRDEPDEEAPVLVNHYFIIPFGAKSERTASNIPTVRVCIIISAHTGEFEEVTTFGKPVTYLTRVAAIKAVAAYLHRDVQALQDAEATTMYQSSEISHVRAYPFWRVAVDERHYYVDQAGKVYDKLSGGAPDS